MRRAAFLAAAAATLMIAGCSGHSDDQDLQNFVKDAEQLPRGRIPPLPEPSPSAPPQRFDAFNLPDPFQPKGPPSKLDESTRSTRSLLARYATVEELDAARARTRGSLESDIAAGKTRVASLRSSEADLRQKLAANKDAKQPPEELTAALKDHETRLRAAEKDLALLSQELAGLDARFDDDRKRYIELSRKK